MVSPVLSNYLLLETPKRALGKAPERAEWLAYWTQPRWASCAISANREMRGRKKLAVA